MAALPRQLAWARSPPDRRPETLSLPVSRRVGTEVTVTVTVRGTVRSQPGIKAAARRSPANLNRDIGNLKPGNVTAPSRRRYYSSGHYPQANLRVETKAETQTYGWRGDTDTVAQIRRRAAALEG